MKLVFKGFSNKSSLVRITKTTLPALWLVLLFAFALPLPAIADSQEVLQARREITGTVTDVESQPLPGVTVQVVGRQGGVITDIDGRYSIQAATGEEIRFQYLGMRSVTSTVGTGNTLNVILHEDVELLDEVTITAFATQKKESVVSSIETINPRELRVPSSNLTTALAG